MDAKSIAIHKIQRQMKQMMDSKREKTPTNRRRRRVKSASTSEERNNAMQRESQKSKKPRMVSRRKSYPPTNSESISQSSSSSSVRRVESIATVRTKTTGNGIHAEINKIDHVSVQTGHERRTEAKAYGIKSPVPASYRQPAEKRTHLLQAKYTNQNNLGYAPRRNNRHPHQTRRQNFLLAYEYGIPAEEFDDSDDGF